MNSSVETILIYIILSGLLSIIYGFFTGKSILSSSTGNAKMQEIASAIQVGAKAYLNRQYKTIAIVGVVVLVIISYAFSILVGLGYFIGATLLIENSILITGLKGLGYTEVIIKLLKFKSGSGRGTYLFLNFNFQT